MNLSWLMDNPDRQFTIRQRLGARLLPRERTIVLWQGTGFGQICNGCGSPIVTAQTMWLLCADDWMAIRLHAECFTLWEQERGAATTPGSA